MEKQIIREHIDDISISNYISKERLLEEIDSLDCTHIMIFEDDANDNSSIILESYNERLETDEEFNSRLKSIERMIKSKELVLNTELDRYERELRLHKPEIFK